VVPVTWAEFVRALFGAAIDCSWNIARSRRASQDRIIAGKFMINECIAAGPTTATIAHDQLAGQVNLDLLSGSEEHE
jgi:hypothetical protein